MGASEIKAAPWKFLFLPHFSLESCADYNFADSQRIYQVDLTNPQEEPERGRSTVLTMQQGPHRYANLN